MSPEPVWERDVASPFWFWVSFSKRLVEIIMGIASLKLCGAYLFLPPLLKRLWHSDEQCRLICTSSGATLFMQAREKPNAFLALHPTSQAVMVQLYASTIQHRYLTSFTYVQSPLTRVYVQVRESRIFLLYSSSAPKQLRYSYEHQLLSMDC